MINMMSLFYDWSQVPVPSNYEQEWAMLQNIGGKLVYTWAIFLLSCGICSWDQKSSLKISLLMTKSLVEEINRIFCQKSHSSMRHKMSQAPRVSIFPLFLVILEFQNKSRCEILIWHSLIWYPSILEHIYVCGVHRFGVRFMTLLWS